MLNGDIYGLTGPQIKFVELPMILFVARRFGRLQAFLALTWT